MDQTNTTQTENSKQEKPKSQQSKLKNFEVIEKNLATVGITPNLANKPFPFNWTILFGFSLLGFCIFCLSQFIIHDAETFAQYTQSIYVGSLATLIIFALLILVFNVKKLFKFINRNDDFINTSEHPTHTYREHLSHSFCQLVYLALKYSASRTIFKQTLQLEKKLNEIVFFLMIKMSPVCALLPFIVSTCFTYFTTDSGPAAFKLPSPKW